MRAAIGPKAPLKCCMDFTARIALLVGSMPTALAVSSAAMRFSRFAMLLLQSFDAFGQFVYLGHSRQRANGRQ